MPEQLENQIKKILKTHLSLNESAQTFNELCPYIENAVSVAFNSGYDLGRSEGYDIGYADRETEFNESFDD